MTSSVTDVKNISRHIDSLLMSSTNSFSTSSVIPVEGSPISLNVTSEVPTPDVEDDSNGHKFNYVYVLLPLGALLFITIFTFVVVYIFLCPAGQEIIKLPLVCECMHVGCACVHVSCR